MYWADGTRETKRASGNSVCLTLIVGAAVTWGSSWILKLISSNELNTLTSYGTESKYLGPRDHFCFPEFPGNVHSSRCHIHTTRVGRSNVNATWKSANAEEVGTLDLLSKPRFRERKLLAIVKRLWICYLPRVRVTSLGQKSVFRVAQRRPAGHGPNEPKCLQVWYPEKEDIALKPTSEEYESEVKLCKCNYSFK